ncbi:MAG: FadR/GntR family transcriptional regulator, partial [Gammaproteobacteria bacterium]
MKRSSVIEVDPVTVSRAYQVVARAIGDKVMSGAWQVGMALPGEWALAQAFGVTRSTIREALRALEQDGLLSRPRGSKQLVIHAPGDVQVSSRMRAAIILQEITFLELWETMMALDPAAAEAAARNASPEQLAALHENQRKTAEVLD